MGSNRCIIHFGTFTFTNQPDLCLPIALRGNNTKATSLVCLYLLRTCFILICRSSVHKFLALPAGFEPATL